MKCANHKTCKGYAEGRSEYCRLSACYAQAGYCQEANRQTQDERTLDRLERKPLKLSHVWGWYRGRRKP